MAHKETQDRVEIERRLSTVETIVTEIKDNHLVHLDAKMDRIQWLIVTTLVAVLTTLLLKIFP